MDVPYKSFLSSAPLLVQGPEGQSFHAHGNLIVQHSRVLAVEITGDTLENREKRIEIGDIDGDINDATVMRFIEYAYIGDYTVPGPEIQNASVDAGLPCCGRGDDGTISAQKEMSFDREDTPQTPVQDLSDQFPDAPAVADGDPEQNLWGLAMYGGSTLKIKKKNKKSERNQWLHQAVDDRPAGQFGFRHPATARERLWSAFQSEAKIMHRPSWEPRANPDPSEEYSQVLLCHARLYAFSSRYDCEGLMLLCLQKLRLTLSRFTLHDERIDDIANLARYSYKHTMDFEDGMDRLRHLVIQYVVCNLEKLMSSEDFKQLLEEPGKLAKDLMTRLMDRLD